LIDVLENKIKDKKVIRILLFSYLVHEKNELKKKKVRLLCFVFLSK